MSARNKELRAQIEQLEFDNAEGEEIANGLREQVAALKEWNGQLESVAKDNAALKGEVKALRNQIAEQKKDIRKQTEADLLLNALQAVGIVPKPKGVDHYARAGLFG